MSTKRTLNGHAKVQPNGHHAMDEDEDELNDRPNKQRRVVNSQKMAEEYVNTSVLEEQGEEEDEFESSQPTQSQVARKTQRERQQTQRAPAQSNGRESAEYVADSDEEDDMAEMDSDQSGSEPESGIIESIKLENFMCHKHFEINLGPNVNFVSGQNGSGKSAVLVALITCLGAKAGFTNRGHKLTDLIKHGENQAIVTLRLRNRGPEAYKPEKYGNAIIIERRINKNSGSGYKVKDSTGKNVISDKLNEVTMILEQFNIQIENPLAILMQDTSRMFLNAATPAEKYKLFMTATQLEQISKDFDYIDDHTTLIKNNLSMKSVMIDELEKKVKSLEAEYKEYQQLVDLQDRVQELKKKMVWVHIDKLSRAIQDKERILEGLRKTKTEREKKISTIRSQIEKITYDINNSQVEMQTFADNREKLSAERQTLEDKIRVLDREQSSSMSKYSEIEKKINIFKTREKRQQDMIREEKKKIEHSRRNQPKQQDLDRKKNELQKIIDRLQTISTDKPEKDEQMQRAKRDLDEAARSKAHLDEKLNKLNKSLSVLMASKKDFTKVYHERMSDLLQLIASSHRQFKRVPIGPVGMSIKVLDERWAYAIETALSRGLLRGFIVDNFEDSRVLEKLAERLHMRVEYVVSKFEDHVYPDAVIPHGQGPVIYIGDLIEVDKPDVYNYLLDQRKVNIVFSESRQTAEDMLYGKNLPSGTRDVYLLNGSKVMVTQSGGRAFIGNKDGYATMLKSNTDHVIEQTKNEIDQLKPKLHDLQQNVLSIQKSFDQLKQAVMGMEKESNELKRKSFSVENDIKTIEESMTHEISEDTSELEQGLEQLRNDIEALREQLKEGSNVQNEFEEKKIPYNKELESNARQARTIAAQLDRFESLLEGARKKENDLRNELMKTDISIAEVDRKYSAMQSEIDKDNASYQLDRAKALEYCDEVEVSAGDTVEKIQSTVNILQKQVDDEQKKKKRPREQTYKLYQENRDKCYNIQRQQNNVKKLLTQLTEHLNQRYGNWQKFRLRISSRTTQYFNIFLTRKGYSGELKFDHEQGTLEINVNLQKNQQSTQDTRGGDTKSLSGGERSFSTVSLLLALWEAMECPFRAMDEFDVFMDEVNRRISIDLLMSKAKENTSKQYIFVTPLSLNSVTPGPLVWIHKVHPPVRGQTIINSSHFTS